jgi:hypothetical protein
MAIGHYRNILVSLVVLFAGLAYEAERSGVDVQGFLSQRALSAANREAPGQQ